MQSIRRRRCQLVFSMAIGWVCAGTSLAAADRVRPSPEWAVLIANVETRLAVSWSLEEASRWLAAVRCQSLLTEFRDQNGQPLADRLTVLGSDIQAYFRRIRFVEGSSYRMCRSAAAFTSPGSFVVFICDSEFQNIWRSDKLRAAAIVLHEALHSLGLGENPPTSVQITNRVLALCTGR
jgi:hypothetical protein